jgi:hypothetical protein
MFMSRVQARLRSGSTTRLHGRRETLTLGKYGPSGLSLARAREAIIDAKRAV